MKDRAELVFEGAHLVVNAMSNEDIFLFKGVAGRRRDQDDMAALVEADRGLDFDVIIEEFLAQLPMNRGQTEWELLTGAPKNHPVIAFLRAIISLPMTLPGSFTDQIEREADRVYAEFEVIGELGDQTTVTDLTRALVSRNTVEIDSRSDVEAVLESLVEKDLVTINGETVSLNHFDS